MKKIPSNQQIEIISDLTRRKKVSRAYLRSLPPLEKVAQLAVLQERYYQMLFAREKNGGRPIPEKWRKWHKARYENSKEIADKFLDNKLAR